MAQHEFPSNGEPARFHSSHLRLADKSYDLRVPAKSTHANLPHNPSGKVTTHWENKPFRHEDQFPLNSKVVTEQAKIISNQETTIAFLQSYKDLRRQQDIVSPRLKKTSQESQRGVFPDSAVIMSGELSTASRNLVRIPQEQLAFTGGK